MNSMADIWSRVLEILEKELTAVAIDTWFKDARIVDIKDGEILIHYSSDFKREIVESRWMPQLKNALKEIFAADFDIKLLDDDGARMYRERKPQKSGGLLDSGIYTFDNFVVGPSNQFAHAAALAVAEEQTSAYNPLFIYGNSGLGKTHLLCAIRHTMRLNHPDWDIVYVKGEDFMNELISAIQTGKTPEFRDKYRKANLFLMDDVQFIAGKIQTQEEFFNTFNTLYEDNRQIVFTSDRPPAEIYQLTDRLKTRFESGLLADINPPDFETRMAIINKKALQLGVVLPEAVCRYIAEKMTANVRQIEGSVKRLKAYRDLTGEEMTVELAERELKAMYKEGADSITPDMIIEQTAKYFGFTMEDIKGQNRAQKVAQARHISVYLCRKLTNLSLNDIGDYFEGRDHSTIKNSIAVVEKQLKKDKSYSQIIRDISANVSSKV